MPSAEVAVHRGRSPLNEEELRSLASRAWHELGILVIDPEKLKNWLDKQHAINIGTAMFGRRNPPPATARRDTRERR